MGGSACRLEALAKGGLHHSTHCLELARAVRKDMLHALKSLVAAYSSL